MQSEVVKARSPPHMQRRSGNGVIKGAWGAQAAAEAEEEAAEPDAEEPEDDEEVEDDEVRHLRC